MDRDRPVEPYLQAERVRMRRALTGLTLTTFGVFVTAPAWVFVLAGCGAFLILLVILTHYADDAIAFRAVRTWRER